MILSKINLPSESSFDAGWAESVNNVPSEPERDRFRGLENPPLFKSYAQIDVNQLGSCLVNQNVLNVTVAKSWNAVRVGGA